METSRRDIFESHDVKLCVPQALKACFREYQPRNEFHARPGAVNPFRIAVPFWGQTTQISSRLSPERNCGPKRVLHGMHDILNVTP